MLNAIKNVSVIFQKIFIKFKINPIFEIFNNYRQPKIFQISPKFNFKCRQITLLENEVSFTI